MSNIEVREKIAIAVLSAKAFANQVSLKITGHIFEFLGNKSTATKYNFDRYRRDLRTLVLQDTLDYKLRDIGNWLLNQEFPIVIKYS
ncbi:hypothetical protein [Anabaena sphaerica]|uniref:hypothetical protein n=1 Tax=Anabaena sphaerica TaxID=212446 RepID=UPI001F55383A|nr:hypothetical protein [Anabaena sphaerica]